MPRPPTSLPFKCRPSRSFLVSQLLLTDPAGIPAQILSCTFTYQGSPRPFRPTSVNQCLTTQRLNKLPIHQSRSRKERAEHVWSVGPARANVPCKRTIRRNPPKLCRHNEQSPLITSGIEIQVMENHHVSGADEKTRSVS